MGHNAFSSEQFTSIYECICFYSMTMSLLTLFAIKVTLVQLLIKTEHKPSTGELNMTSEEFSIAFQH